MERKYQHHYLYTYIYVLSNKVKDKHGQVKTLIRLNWTCESFSISTTELEFCNQILHMYVHRDRKLFLK